MQRSTAPRELFQSYFTITAIISVRFRRTIYQPVRFIRLKPEPLWWGFYMRRQNLRRAAPAACLWAQASVTSAALLSAAGSGADSTRPDGCRSTPRARFRSQAVPGALCLLWDYTDMAKSLSANLSRWRRGVSLLGQRVLFPIFLKETVAGQMEAEHKLSSSHSYCSETSIILTTNNKPF